MAENADPSFLTFRIETPAKRPDHGDVRVRKRLRSVLSCQPCHRAKVRCDRGQPCSRCRKSLRTSQCTYDSTTPHDPKRTQARAGDADPGIAPLPPPAARTNPSHQYYTTPNHFAKGLTHFSKLLTEFDDVRRYLFDEVPEFHSWHDRLKDVKRHFRCTMNNAFTPFSVQQRDDALPSEVLQYMLDKARMRLITKYYTSTFDVVFPLLDLEEVHSDCEALFCDLPLTRQAQLLFMSALTGNAAPHLFNEGPSILELFLARGQSCLAQSQYNSFPDLAAVRSLCMMAILLLIRRDSPATASGLWPLNGFIVRLGLSMRLHDPSGEMDQKMAALQCRLWWTIVFLDLNAAIESGFPPVLRTGDWNSEAVVPSPTDDYSLVTALAKVYQTVSDALVMVNSAATKDVDYKDVLYADAALREYLRLHVKPGDRTVDDPSELPGHALGVENLVRRTLLALHQPYALRRGERHEFETSHWAVLECSLATLGAQQTFWSLLNRSDHHWEWLFIIGQSHYTCAMFHVINGLRRGAFDGSSAGHSDRPSPPETARIALSAAHEILTVLAPLSHLLYRHLIGVSLSLAALHAHEDRLPIHDSMVSAANALLKTMENSGLRDT